MAVVSLHHREPAGGRPVPGASGVVGPRATRPEAAAPRRGSVARDPRLRQLLSSRTGWFHHHATGVRLVVARPGRRRAALRRARQPRSAGAWCAPWWAPSSTSAQGSSRRATCCASFAHTTDPSRVIRPRRAVCACGRSATRRLRDAARVLTAARLTFGALDACVRVRSTGGGHGGDGQETTRSHPRDVRRRDRGWRLVPRVGRIRRRRPSRRVPAARRRGGTPRGALGETAPERRGESEATANSVPRPSAVLPRSALRHRGGAADHVAHRSGGGRSLPRRRRSDQRDGAAGSRGRPHHRGHAGHPRRRPHCTFGRPTPRGSGRHAARQRVRGQRRPGVELLVGDGRVGRHPRQQHRGARRHRRSRRRARSRWRRANGSRCAHSASSTRTSCASSRRSSPRSPRRSARSSSSSTAPRV